MYKFINKVNTNLNIFHKEIYEMFSASLNITTTSVFLMKKMEMVWGNFKRIKLKEETSKI